LTDGPFAEAKEHLAGFYVLNTESIERATEIVAMIRPRASVRSRSGRLSPTARFAT
jgi:hypothetical protein